MPTRDRGFSIRLTPSAAVIVIGSLLAAFVIAQAFAAAQRPVGWAVACAVVAILIDPLVERLDRVIPRLLSVIAVLLVLVVIVAAVVVGIVQDINTSLDELRDAAPDAAAQLETRSELARDFRLTDRVENFIDELDARVDRQRAKTLSTAPTYFVTGILMLFFLAYGRRYWRSLLEQIDDPVRRAQLRSTVVPAIRRGRIWLLGTLATALVIGGVTWALLHLMDVRAALSLATIVGVLSIIPGVGVLVGSVPALLMTAGFRDGESAVLLAIVLLVVQLFQALVIRPRLEAETVHIGPSLPIVVGLLSFALYGIGGAMYGIALAVFAITALDAYGHRPDRLAAANLPP